MKTYKERKDKFLQSLSSNIFKIFKDRVFTTMSYKDSRNNEINILIFRKYKLTTEVYLPYKDEESYKEALKVKENFSIGDFYDLNTSKFRNLLGDDDLYFSEAIPVGGKTFYIRDLVRGINSAKLPKAYTYEYYDIIHKVIEETHKRCDAYWKRYGKDKLKFKFVNLNDID